MDTIQELLLLSLKQYIKFSDSVEDEINELHFIRKSPMTRELRSPESRCVYYLRQFDINSKSINEQLLQTIQDTYNIYLQNLKFEEPSTLFQEILEFIYQFQFVKNNFNLQEEQLNNLLTCSLYNGKIWSLIILLNSDQNLTTTLLQLIKKIYYSNHPDLRLVLNSIILYISNKRENQEQLYLQILKYCQQLEYQNEIIQLIKMIQFDQYLIYNNEIKQIIIEYFIKNQDTPIQIWKIIGNLIYNCNDILKELSNNIIDLIQLKSGQYFKVGCQLFVKVLEITPLKLPQNLFKQLYEQLLSKDKQVELLEKGLIINCLIAIILYTDFKLKIEEINIQEMSFLLDIEDIDIQLSILIFFIVIYQQEQQIIRKENYQFQNFINRMMISNSDQCREQAKYLYEELYDKQE